MAMEKLTQTLTASLSSRLLLLGYDHDIFSHLKEPITVTGIYVT